MSPNPPMRAVDLLRGSPTLERKTEVIDVHPDPGLIAKGAFRATIPTAGQGLEIISGALAGARVILARAGTDETEIVPGQYSLTAVDTGRPYPESFDRLIVTWDTAPPADVPLRLRIFQGISAVPIYPGQGTGMRLRNLVRGNQLVNANTCVVVYDDNPGSGGLAGNRWRPHVDQDTPFGYLRGFVMTGPAATPVDFNVVIQGASDDTGDPPPYSPIYNFGSSLRSAPNGSGLGNPWEVVAFQHMGGVNDTGAVPCPEGRMQIMICNADALTNAKFHYSFSVGSQ